ncbi:Phosphoesterase HXTX [Xylanimonas cellulosilytica DSM 15894]|uniref:Phosphoesterase HXTX n=1 Tax=Xylanimonas cellulosilytica (strain DSM 15894 / JCM 12276 / CECT 5975 / KCTC 9989 / LMG 20990 / NBRC 107835 / XIL07) TaxID=446471 RepID=D1BYU1_XYLCX|nr:2'-5' RNA ligase family protein [Xylanimonas cellulosilytica]ACZ30016.1 Phosphoesterase HXTX [Xylanimonas cellulosilytica DSM 15894]
MHLPERGPAQARIGISVAVPEPWATTLQEARTGFGDERATLIPPHVTVVGPTVVDEAVMPAVWEHLEKVANETPVFRLHLRGSGTFRPVSPVVFVNVVEGIAECEQLERAARSGILAQDSRFNYHPHVTVAHELPDAALDRAFTEMAGFDAAFDVTAIWQYEHGDDGVWRAQRAFPLRAP